MKRVGHLWPRVVSYSNLLAAALAAMRGKRSRSDVARFVLDLEAEALARTRSLR